MKPRQTILKTDMGKPKVINSFSIDKNGDIKLMFNGKVITPIRANLIKHYDRDNGKKKPKIVVDIPSKTDRLSINIDRIVKKYDVIYAIDTNSKMIKGKLITACCFARFNPKDGVCDLLAPVVLINEALNEKMGWVELIRSIIQDIEYRTDFNIAIIVDSDYGNISKYNSRELPLIDNLYLPRNFELIYASTDTGMENLFNKLISECDKLAKSVYKKFE